MSSAGRIFLSGVILCIPFFASASEKIGVVPAFQVLTLDANQSIKSEIEIQNQTTTDQQFLVRSVDFSSLDASGGVAFLGSDLSNEDLPSSDFIILKNDTLDIPAGETKTFPFEIRDLRNLAPGGHYAALVFQSLPVTDEDAPQKIAVRQIFSSLIFLEKTGGSIKDLQLQELPNRHLLWALPKKMDLVFTNNGNTHVAPRGTIQLEGMFGHIRTCAALNESSSLLLPGQARVFPINLKCQLLLPGRYTLLISYRYDGQEDFREVKDTFFFLPYPLAVITGAGSALLILFIQKGLLSRKKKSVTS